MAVEKIIPSGLTDGGPLAVTDSWQTFHTAHASSKDQTLMYAMNPQTDPYYLFIKVDSAEPYKKSIPAENGKELAFTNLLTNSKVIQVKSDTTDKLYVDGEVNRITPNG